MICHKDDFLKSIHDSSFRWAGFMLAAYDFQRIEWILHKIII